MFATTVLLLVFGISQAAQIVLMAIVIRAAAQWARIPGVTLGRSALVTFQIIVVYLVILVAFIATQPALASASISASLLKLFVGLIGIAILIGLPVIAIRSVFRASSWQAWRVWLPTFLLSSLFSWSLAALVIKPFLSEAFTMPTNSMAPTILGDHLTDVCPTCGKPAFGSPRRDREYPDGTLMICGQFHVHASKAASKLSDGDRFLVLKILRPRRWDLIAFRFPGDPTMNYVKRLVGLPGEEVFIKDGSVWINGQRLEPPESLRGLEFVTEFPNAHFQPKIWGTPDRSAKLGKGEYFVLGDFSQQSADSRLWETGAPGHPSYAVPESYLIGVVTHIYWPPGRWRILR